MIRPAATRPEPIVDSVTARLLGTVAAAPLAPLRLLVQAPGGHGKSTLLAELAELYRAAGVPVLDSWTGELPPEAVLLVDDAHLLGPDQLTALTRLAETGVPRLVVAARPWPRPAGLAELTELLGRFGPPLLLAPWTDEQLGAYLAGSGRPDPGPVLTGWLRAQTGGVPALVERVTVGLPARLPAEPELGEAATAALRAELELLDPDVLRFLLAAEAGPGLDLDLLAELLGRDAGSVADVVAAARATGLLGPEGEPLPALRAAIRSWRPADRLVGIRLRLAELRLRRGGSVLDLAKSLLGAGITGAGVAAVFTAAAGEAVSPDSAGTPALAAELFAAAAAAGTPVSELGARWAQAAALSGDLDTALRLADGVIGAEDAPDREQGALVAATALVHRGQLARGTELYLWAGSGPARAFAALGLLGTGQADAARSLLAAPAAGGPPTLLAGAATLMSQGVAESLTGAPTAALSTVVRSAALLEPAGAGVLLPDSPAALAALIALHCGELDLAESVLDRAIRAGLGGEPLAVRHRLLQAWICMVRGRLGAAAEYLAVLGRTASALEPRDWLFAVALEAGLARRNSDLGTLRRIWGHACEAVMRHSVDLFTLLPLGEFAIAAARLREADRLAPHLREAAVLLDRLGDPPLWAISLRWSLLHAAIIGEHADVAAEHAAALAGHAPDDRYGAALAAAARCWLAVTSGRVDPDAVRAAADGLDAVGLTWDGARLAGQAAIRTSDRKAMVGLLECARQLQARSAAPRADRSGSLAAPAPATATDPFPPAPTHNPAGEIRLSERELEVARLVLDGLTYKQVGDRLFISAKTVEHHVARMRQRLGATSRPDLLARLRTLTTNPGL